MCIRDRKSIPNEPIEAAKIDGASEWEITRYIRLPMIRSLLFLVLIVSIVSGFLSLNA